MKNYRSILLTVVSSILFMASAAPGWAQDPNVHLPCGEKACIWDNFQVGRNPGNAKGVHFYGNCTVGPKKGSVQGMSAVAKHPEMKSCGTNSGGFYCIFNKNLPPGGLASVKLWVCCEDSSWYSCGPQ